MKKFKVVFKIMLLSMFLLTSCSDDDDDVSSSGLDSDAGLILEEDGIKYYLTSVGNTEYTYDVDGNLLTLGDFDVTYSPLLMTYSEEGNNKDETITYSDFSINSKGYITQFTEKSTSSNYKYDSYQSYEIVYKFSYDSNGRLQKMTCKDETNTNGEDSFESTTTTFSWENGLLTKLSAITVDEEDSEVQTLAVFNYDDYEYPNITGQYTSSMLDIEWMGPDDFAYLGYLGVGSAYLPEGIEVSDIYVYYEDGELEEEDEEWSYTYTYEFNDNGTVDTEKKKSSKHTSTTEYTYTTRW